MGDSIYDFSPNLTGDIDKDINTLEKCINNLKCGSCSDFISEEEISNRIKVMEIKIKELKL